MSNMLDLHVLCTKLTYSALYFMNVMFYVYAQRLSGVKLCGELGKSIIRNSVKIGIILHSKPSTYFL